MYSVGETSSSVSYGGIKVEKGMLMQGFGNGQCLPGPLFILILSSYLTTVTLLDSHQVTDDMFDWQKTWEETEGRKSGAVWKGSLPLLSHWKAGHIPQARSQHMCDSLLQLLFHLGDIKPKTATTEYCIKFGVFLHSLSIHYFSKNPTFYIL